MEAVKISRYRRRRLKTIATEWEIMNKYTIAHAQESIEELYEAEFRIWKS